MGDCFLLKKRVSAAILNVIQFIDCFVYLRLEVFKIVSKGNWR